MPEGILTIYGDPSPVLVARQLDTDVLAAKIVECSEIRRLDYSHCHAALIALYELSRRMGSLSAALAMVESRFPSSQERSRARLVECLAGEAADNDELSRLLQVPTEDLERLEQSEYRVERMLRLVMSAITGTGTVPKTSDRGDTSAPKAN